MTDSCELERGGEPDLLEEVRGVTRPFCRDRWSVYCLKVGLGNEFCYFFGPS